MYPYNFKPELSYIDLCKVFIAMPFHEDYEVIYTDLIIPALAEVNKTRDINEKLFRYRAKDPKYLRSGWMEILENLVTARLTIGVLEGNNANVFYELGIAHATQQKERQILIAPEGYKAKFDLKDLIFKEYNFMNLSKSIDELSSTIQDTLMLYNINNDRLISKAESKISYFEFEIMRLFSNNSHFVLLDNSPQRFYDGVAYLCHAGLLRLSTKPIPKRNKIEFSYYWTNIGNAVLRKLNVIDESEFVKRISEYRKFFKT